MEMIQRRWVNVGHMNTKGRLFGGNLLSWADEDASLFAYDNVILTNLPDEDSIELTTAGMCNCQFLKPVKLADRLTFYYKIVHFSNTSITISTKVKSKDQDAYCFFGLITFVGINSNGAPCKIAHRLIDVDVEALKKEPVWEFVECFKKLSKKGLIA